MKDCIFISSSSKQIKSAKALEANLSAEGFEPTLWSREAHEASRYNLEALLTAANSSDFAAFVFAADDMITVEDRPVGVVRDNVLFELGLFIGKLGRDRCFVLQDVTAPMHMPSDLDGLTVLKYTLDRSDGNVTRALGPVATNIASLARATSVAAASALSDNDIKLLRACENTGWPSSQALKAFGAQPTHWEDQLCMRFLRLHEYGLVETTGPTEVRYTRRGALLSESKRAR